MEILDTVKGTWSTAAPLAAARSFHSSTLVGDLLYVRYTRWPAVAVDLGRSFVHRNLDSAEVLDIVSGAWRTLEPDAIPLEAVAGSNLEVMCEYKEQPSTRTK